MTCKAGHFFVYLMHMILTILTILLFYLFAILQGSFFAHYNAFGAIPNLVFIFFFLVIFFRLKMDYAAVFYAVIAGFFLDILSYTFLGPSAVLLLVIGFLAKKMQTSLKEKKDKYPFAHFAPLFIIWFALYGLSWAAYLYFFDPSHLLISLNFSFLAGIIYNLMLASLGFFVFKKVIKSAGH